VAALAVAALAAAEDQVAALAVAAPAPVVVARVVEAEPEELVAGPVRPANQESGWPRQQCSREACWAEFRA
jgi:hypothetical protein